MRKPPLPPSPGGRGGRGEGVMPRKARSLTPGPCPRPGGEGRMVRPDCRGHVPYRWPQWIGEAGGESKPPHPCSSTVSTDVLSLAESHHQPQNFLSAIWK